MSAVTYKNLYTLVTEEIDKRRQFDTNSRFGKEQMSRVSVQPFSMSTGAAADINTQELIASVQEILDEALPKRIVSGLSVLATDPPTDQITVTAGVGSTGGTIYRVLEDVTFPVDFDGVTTVFYIHLKNNALMVSASDFSDRLTIAKIIVPDPSLESIIINDRDDNSGNAYIMQFKEQKMYVNDFGVFEEETLDVFRDNIGPILAENLIGNIRLSENLKVTNETGTLEVDSNSINIYDDDGDLLSTFNRNGTFFYNENNIEVAKFTRDGSRIGNIRILPSSIQSANFSSGWQGFKISDSGNAEFNDILVRGTIFATAGSIGGFTLLSNKMYGGTIQTDFNVGAGETGVIMDGSGLRGYDSILGLVFNLPTDGSAPTFSSGIINSTIFEINTNSVLRTSETVGDGTSSSYGILINNTGIYGCGANQSLSSANFKALINGDVRMSGEIVSSSGQIGGVTITETMLIGGIIQGSTIRASIIETSLTTPKIRMDASGLYYQTTTSIGKYGPSSSGNFGFMYGDGTKYGTGVTAFLFNENFPVFAVTAEKDLADIRLYNRSSNPVGDAEIGDLAVVSGKLKICTIAGSPGTWTVVGTQS